MCGIWAVFGALVDVDTTKHHETSAKITHRGPDAWRTECDNRMKNGCFSFHRLSINDGLCGMQPMKRNINPHLTLLCNGEIYNCKRLRDEFNFTYESKCDVECILHLYTKLGAKQAASMLDGVFAFCLVDALNRRVLIARDPFGVRPLFKLTGPGGVLGVCSEAKGLIKLMEGHDDWKMDPFPPGCFEEYELNPEGGATFLRQQRFYSIGDKPHYKLAIQEKDYADDIYTNIRSLLTTAVEKRLMSDRRIGCLLSGGLDSSLVAALLVKLAKDAGVQYKVQTFSIGMGEESPDLVAARRVAAHIGSEHHEVVFTEEDVRSVLDSVLYHLEIADITTLRASIPMFLLSKYIKEKTDSTVIFSGEGADEVAQGYIYFRDAPSAEEAHQESLRLLNELYIYDVLRSDRATSAHSLEVRVPFLDHQFTSYYLSLPKELRQPQKGVEKFILRKAFDGDLLPHDILWRHKEAFSDGVASKKKPLFKILQESVEALVNDEQVQEASKRFPHCTPKTKEAFYYRQVFDKNFPGQDHWLPYFWMPRWSDATDPSAQFISHYAAE
ncbi:asparagine synthetase [glutamine-hydrolyzing] [Neocloeon triangulifer]|uniref:asparagine synthetase [glutamine-hydrolyzing] n=1 Tax=Neocloeon triangulifer TaxID=2078957 RepID=UPI00286EC68E|nr:asparagine synthetase [glutamine-hydrolyzing] [Neocloeon triangulifer]